MANVEHSALTGSNLHEPKGASTATVSTVYVSDGVGSGSWTTLGVSSLASSAKAFQGQLFHVQNSQPSGTAGQALTGGAWTKVTLQTTVTSEITSASLSSSQITLPAGTYYIEASACWYYVLQSGTKNGVLKLWNVTDASTTRLGKAVGSGQTGSTVTVFNNSISELKGRFTIATAKTFELQMYTNATAAGGNPTSTGENEIYADVTIWKTA